MSHAVALVTDDRNRVRAQCRCSWRSPWITAQGISVSLRGRVAGDVIAQYETANA